MTAEHTVKDPVCGMSVNPHSAEHRSEHGGKTWYFCSSGCKSKLRVGNDYFIKQPDGRLLVRIRSCGFSPLESLQV